TKIIAGHNGIDNKITWAHPCELDDPTTWLVGGELITTNGIAIPSYPDNQINYIKRLINSNVSGLAISRGLHSPDLSKELLDFANNQSFPILLTDYEVPWIALSKTVAITNANQDYAKILKVLKLYDLIRQSIYNQSTSEILHLIGNIIDCNMQVIDIKNGEQLYDITGQKSSTEKLSSKQQFIQIPVPVSRPMSLLINSRSQKVLDELIIN